ncbi:unnamed protein product, partial [Meganyctiphanes norvegica]
DIETVQTTGDKKLTELRTLGDKVTVSTSERGGRALRATLNSMEDAWNLHLATVGDVRRNLEGALVQWSQFEQQLDCHASWCREKESFFKDQQLCSSLEEKEDRISLIASKREEIVQYEREVDIFVDQSHALVRISSVDRLKPLITQLSNRYQALHVLSKDTCSKWKGLVTDHKTYVDKLTENTTWISAVETALKELLQVKTSDSR